MDNYTFLFVLLVLFLLLLLRSIVVGLLAITCIVFFEIFCFIIIFVFEIYLDFG